LQPHCPAPVHRRNEPGIQHGYVHVQAEPGNSDFVAYGLIRDGAVAGQGSGDVSCVPMVRGSDADRALGHYTRRRLTGGR
jgi:hypothetical protein